MRRRLAQLMLWPSFAAVGPLAGQERTDEPPRLTIPEGDTATVRTGRLEGYQTAEYRLAARAGQLLRVRVRSPRETWLVVRAFPTTQEVGADLINTFTTGLVGGEARIPADGDYTVRLAIHRVEARRGGGARWTLTVALSEPDPADARVATDAPESWREEGACPFECCTYGGDWALRGPLDLRGSADRYAVTFRQLPSGERVTALTGRTRTRAGRFRFTRASPPFGEGEPVDVYDYLGEGGYRVWHGGAMIRADLGLSPYGAGREGPLGRMEVDPRQTWWVNVRLRDGREGWIEILDPTDVDGADACAVGL